MSHALLHTADIRAIEARGLATTSPGELMSRASAALGQVCAQHLRRLGAGTPVLALVGPGNNGGDALLAALWLHARGWSVQALPLVPASTLNPDVSLPDDARRARARWQALGREWLAPDQLDTWLQARDGGATLVIDGLFGIGLQRPLSGVAQAVVQTLRSFRVTVIAADVPSGIDADTGAIVGPPGSVAVRADATVTFIADKPGLHTGAGLVHAGSVALATLGLSQDGPTAGILIDQAAARRWARPRARDAHKGSQGTVMVVRGAPSMQGAALLALLGAQAGGAGRLYLGLDAHDLPDVEAASALCAAPASTVQTGVDSLHPEFMRRALHGTAAASPAEVLQAWGPADALVVGCGLGTGPRAQRVVAMAILHPGALVLDADGLNTLALADAGAAVLLSRAQAGRLTVITPHPLEAARLLRCSTDAIQGDRIAAARRLAHSCGAVTVLKGAGTVIAWPASSDKAAGTLALGENLVQTRWALNTSGGPLLAVAGTGDVLAGVVAALLAQGLAAHEAACLGAWLHGAAADALAARPEWAAGIGLPASQLPEAVRAVINLLAADRS